MFEAVVRNHRSDASVVIRKLHRDNERTTFVGDRHNRNWSRGPWSKRATDASVDVYTLYKHEHALRRH